MGLTNRCLRLTLTDTAEVIDVICGVADRVHLCDSFRMSDVRQNLERALETALAQYVETMGEAFPMVPALDVVDDPIFWAVAEMDGDKFRIRASVGTAHRTASLWGSAFADEEFRESFGKPTGADASMMTHISLIWLMLHELHHCQMGHFDATSIEKLSKKEASEERGLVTRPKRSAPTHSFNTAETNLLIEMQADHDATEMLLDAYSPDEWLSLRTRVAAISAMMMLIERADSSNQTSGVTHPKAATRIFQLLGHVIDMPLLAAHSGSNQGSDRQNHLNNLPTQAEQECFAAQVVVPAFFDAVSLAMVAAAGSITHDLGSANDFFRDVQVAKLISGAGSDEFVTSGAKQWSSLVKFRDKAVLLSLKET